jgi:hypothetical protein
MRWVQRERSWRAGAVKGPEPTATRHHQLAASRAPYVCERVDVLCCTTARLAFEFLARAILRDGDELEAEAQRFEILRCAVDLPQSKIKLLEIHHVGRREAQAISKLDNRNARCCAQLVRAFQELPRLGCRLSTTPLRSPRTQGVSTL